MLPQYNYSLPRKIWRVLYPSVLYLVVANTIAISGLIYYMVKISLQMMQDVGEVDFQAAWSTAAVIFDDHAMTFALFGYLASIVMFLPIWLRTEKIYPLWTGGRLSLKAVLLVVGVGIGLNFIVSFLIQISGLTEIFTDYEQFQKAAMSGSFYLQIVALGIAAPIAEELCFRGITLYRLSGIKLWAAIIIQAALFGFAHLNILQGLYAFAVGIILGFLSTRFRTLWLPIVLHIVFNSTNILLNHFVESAGIPETVVGFFALISIAVSVICFAYLLRQKYPGAPETKSEDPFSLDRRNSRRGPDL